MPHTDRQLSEDDGASPDEHDEPPDDGDLSDDGPPIVVEFAVPAEAFVLRRALREHPDAPVAFERLIPVRDGPPEFLWTGDATPAFERAVARDPTVEHVETAARFDDGAFYGVDWTTDAGPLLEWLCSCGYSVALLKARGRDGEWTLTVRFPSQASLADFRAFFVREGVDVRVVRLSELTDSNLDEYGVTDKQRETLLRALEMGYFDVPRDATLADVADALDISPRSASERLRRGHRNLVGNALTTGRGTGVGAGEV